MKLFRWWMSGSKRTAWAGEEIPPLKGEGAAKRRVRGAEKHLFTPHPALRATLSLRERDSRKNISQHACDILHPLNREDTL